MNECVLALVRRLVGRAVTAGATFATSTIATASELVSLAPSESVTLINTFVVAGPSGKVHSKLPPPAFVAIEPCDVRAARAAVRIADDREGVGARIGDRERVRVGRALVDVRGAG